MDELLVFDIGNQIIYQVTMFRVFFKQRKLNADGKYYTNSIYLNYIKYVFLNYCKLIEIKFRRLYLVN